MTQASDFLEEMLMYWWNAAHFLKKWSKCGDNNFLTKCGKFDYWIMDTCLNLNDRWDQCAIG